MRRIVQAIVLAGALPIAAAQEPVAIEAIQVSGPVHMITGQGGNIGVFVGADGVFVIDDQFAPLSATILKKIRELSDEPVRFVVNTHWHSDHTGGNENFAKAGGVIVAHENVRKRMSSEQFLEALGRREPPSPEEALPVVTFTDAVTFHWNGDDVRVFHVANAHTDGDAIIHFRKADAIHMGDCLFNRSYPFIDTSSGGSVAGMIAAADQVLRLAGPSTRIIPGHGPLATREDLVTFRDLLVTVRDRVNELLDAGKSDDEIAAARPAKEFDDAWGKGFMKPEPWLGIVIRSLRQERAARK